MNWTGGGLNRFSKQTSKLKSSKWRHKDRKHQTRASPYSNRNGHLSSPFRPDFLKEDDLRLVVPQGIQSTAWNLNQPKTSVSERSTAQTQSRLENYNAFAPVIRRLESLRPAGAQRIKKEASQDRSREAAPQACATQEDPIQISSEDSESADDSDVNKEVDTIIVPLCSVETLEDKRSRLLSQPDWAGLRHTKPVTVGFGKVDRDNMRKRRKKSHRHIRKHSAASRSRAVSILPVGVEDDGQYMTGALLFEDHDDQNIQVKIGTDALQSSQCIGLTQANAQERWDLQERSRSICNSNPHHYHTPDMIDSLGLIQESPSHQSCKEIAPSDYGEGPRPEVEHEKASDDILSFSSGSQQVDPRDGYRLLSDSPEPYQNEEDGILQYDGAITPIYETFNAKQEIQRRLLAYYDPNIDKAYPNYHQPAQLLQSYRIQTRPELQNNSDLVPTKVTTSQTATRITGMDPYRAANNPSILHDDETRILAELEPNPPSSRPSSSISNTCWKRLIFGSSSPSRPQSTSLVPKSISVNCNHPSSTMSDHCGPERTQSQNTHY